ncbi:transketolase [Secundilactobacillus kimchicus]|uniref:transketolase n=1 Tax=Secundilactobacillus kimchicus TaxID=528209 RepID=UPI0024A95754|nr:transketolase [Secundilactobacillus kimchicus]
MATKNADQTAINALRFLSVDMIEKAQSGHPGLPIDAAPMVYTLWKEILTFNPEDPHWINRDRFILSAGHGSALLYSLLYFNDFGLTLEDLKNFRQIGSKTPGHPEFGVTSGVDATTGPLGQGLGMGVGMAMAEMHLSSLYNRPHFPIIDHYTYVLVGDGDLMEGVSQEAINVAGDKKLSKLIVLYDSNDISLDGKLSLSTNENEQKRFTASGWDYQRVEDGNDVDAILKAIQHAKTTSSPSLIEVKTVIGYGTPDAGTNKVHGSALGEKNVSLMRQHYDWSFPPFVFSDEIHKTFRSALVSKKKKYDVWQTMYKVYQTKFPELYKLLNTNTLDSSKLKVNYATGDKVATRVASSEMIQQMADSNLNFWGGSADLSSSNKTYIENGGTFSKATPDGKNIYYGVREFGMGAAMNGIQLHGGSRTFGSTFLIFSDYMKAAVRLSALQKMPNIFIFSHDSIAVGEDGPTHEPVEQVEALRSIPNVNVFRPADANEVFETWKYMANETQTTSVLVTSRQKLPVLDGTRNAPIDKGGYVLSPSSNSLPDGILIATGSEVQLAIKAQKALKEDHFDVTVVSMPCIELFKQQSEKYQNSVLPVEVDLRIAIEMLDPTVWYQFTGLKGAVIGNDHFGESGKGEAVVKKYGFSADTIVRKFKAIWKSSEK